MPSLDKPHSWLAGKSRVAEHAREVAETGDRWFLSLTGGLVQVGGWARREAWMVADSAVAALATTVEIAKRLGAVEAAPRRSLPAQRAASIADLDLLPAFRTDAPEACDVGLGIAKAPHKNPPGVVPLLQALGRIVSRHAHAGYASLEGDPRFWTLVHLLQRVGHPPETIAATSEDAPGEEALP